MADKNNIDLATKFDDNEIITGLRGIQDELAKTSKQWNDSTDKQERATRDLNDNIDEYIGTVKTQRKETKKTSDETDQAADSTDDLTDSVSDSIAEYEVFGVSLNDVQEYASGMVKSLKASRAAIIANTSATKAFKLALASTGIGAIVVVLASLISYLKNTREGLDFVRASTAYLTNAFETVVDYAAQFGKTIVHAVSEPKKLISDFGTLIKAQIVDRFKGLVELTDAVSKALEALWEWDMQKLKEAALDAGDAMLKFQTGFSAKEWKGAGDAVKRFTSDIVNHGSAAAKLTTEQTKLGDKLRENKTKYKEQRAEIQRLKLVADNEEKSNEERRKAAEKAGKIEQESLDERLKLLQRNLEITQKLNRINTSEEDQSQEQREQEAELIREIAGLKEESMSKQKNILRQIQRVRNESTAATKKQREEQRKLNEEAEKELVALIERAKDSEIQQINDPVEKLMAQKTAALQELAIQRADLLAKFTEGSAEYEAAKKAFKTLKDGIVKEFREQKKELINDLRGDNQAVDLLPEVETSDKIDIKAPEINVENSRGKPFDISEEIGIALGITDEGMEFLEQRVVSAYQNVMAGLQEATQNAIDQQQNLLDTLDQRKQKVQSELEAEREKAEQGKNNNVKKKQEELREIYKAEREAQKKKEKLQARAQRQKLISDSIQQASSLATATATAFQKGLLSGGNPIVGIGLALSAIALMFKLFQGFKQQAQSTSGLYKGTERSGQLRSILHGDKDSGYVNKGGRSDIPGRGKGYRIEDSDIVLGGDEMVMKETVSKDYEPILQAMNAETGVEEAMLSHLGLHKAFKTSEENKIDSIRIDIRKSEKQHDQKQRDEAAKKAIDYYFKRKNSESDERQYYDSDGNKIIQKGNHKVRYIK